MPWFTKLNVFNQTSKRKYVNFIDYPFEEELSKKHRKEILSRVTIVDNEKQSKQILLSLIQKGDPVGVDVEVRVKKFIINILWFSHFVTLNFRELTFLF